MNLAERIAAVREQRPGDAAPTDRSDEVVDRVRAAVLQRLGARADSAGLDDDTLGREVRLVLAEVLDGDPAPLSVAERTRLAQGIVDDLLGHGPLDALLRDPSVSEVMVNGLDNIFVERHGLIEVTGTRFADDLQLRRAIERMVSRVGRRVDESSPMVDARLPDGSRVNVVLPPLALDGPTITIRKFASDTLSADDLVARDTLSAPAAEFLAAAVRARLTMLVSGATGVGKTTLLNILSSFIPSGERIITIEDAAELRLQQRHVVRLETRPPNLEGSGEITVRALVRNALRMRPDRIIVGEVRDSAALDMVQAMSTGHDGSLCTVHASSPRESLARIETMVLTAGGELPLRAVRETLARAIDLIVHLHRTPSGFRQVRSITEVVGMEGEVITLQELFTRQSDEGPLMPTGVRPRSTERMEL